MRAQAFPVAARWLLLMYRIRVGEPRAKRSPGLLVFSTERRESCSWVRSSSFDHTPYKLPRRGRNVAIDFSRDKDFQLRRWIVGTMVEWKIGLEETHFEIEL